MNTPTKALTIRDPWAQAVVFGDKRVENRSQRLDKMLGERVAVHVSQTIDRDAWRSAGLFEAKPPWSEYNAHENLSHPGHIIGSVGWLLDDVIEYRPVEARGMPGFWTIDEDVRERPEER